MRTANIVAHCLAKNTLSHLQDLIDVDYIDQCIYTNAMADGQL